MSFVVKQKKFFGKLTFLFGGVFIVFFLSGWVNVDSGINVSGPAIPPAAPPSGEGDNGEEPEPEMVDVIKNGDFEKPWRPLNGVAPDWEPFSNGRAFFGWYEETWAEAVRKGQGHAQLLEIFEVEANILDRVVAIYQTVDVAPNAEYELTIHAIMRTDANVQFRNKNEFEMHWGIDPFGEGNYENVEEWVLMPLTEQNRIGSNADPPDDTPLFYERITSTVRTADSNRITLFIRGLKKFPTITEVNFDVDDVSLVGPPPGAGPVVIVLPDPVPTAEPPAADSDLPSTGAILSQSASIGVIAIGGLVLVLLGAFATASLLDDRRKT